jgi:hypothetical protein
MALVERVLTSLNLSAEGVSAVTADLGFPLTSSPN